jgi:hypothetical protein
MAESQSEGGNAKAGGAGFLCSNIRECNILTIRRK